MQGVATKLLATLAEKRNYIFTLEQAFITAKELGLIGRGLTRVKVEELLNAHND